MRGMAERKRPNILFLMADQMKWSALKMYSEIGIQMPALERLASQGVMYRHAITPHPLCVPARTSVMTGRYPHSTGCRRNETLMPAREIHAFQIWKDAGYTTGLIGKNHCYIEPEDLARFDVRCEISHAGLPDGDYAGANPGNQGMKWCRPIEAIDAAHQNRKNLNANRQSPRIAYAVSDHPIEDYGTSLITAQTEAFLERFAADESFNAQGRFNDQSEPVPFALWVSYPDPHEPYEAPRRYAEMFPPEDVVMPPFREGEFADDHFDGGISDASYPANASVSPAPEVNRVLHRMMGLDQDKEEDIRGVISIYQAMCRFVDDGIGRILDKLAQLDMMENTIIVFTADHGDFMGEHSMVVKGGVFYDCLTRVPLIVSYPGGNVPKGVTDESMVNTVDILPTLLELQGLGNFDGIRNAWASSACTVPESSADASTLNSHGAVKSHLLHRMQGNPLPTVTAAEPRQAAFSEYGAGGPPVTMKHLEALPKPWGYHSLIQTLWGREAQGRRKMVRTKNWKYVTDPMAHDAGTGKGADPQDELYNLRRDPWELYNVAHDPDNASVISELRRLLAKWMIETEDCEPVPLPLMISRAG